MTCSSAVAGKGNRISTPKNLAINAEEKLLVRIAWACEIEGITQGEAAARFGLTRLRVNKALADARKRGIVRVSIDSDFAPCAELEVELKQQFGLSDAHVAPVTQRDDATSTDIVRRLVGTALGQYLGMLLSSTDITRFGMSWGTTLDYAMQYMKPVNRPDLEITSVMGCVTRAADLNIIESTRLLANLCNAQKSYFTAPLYAGSPESRSTLVAQDVFRNMIERIRTVDALAMTLGDMSTQSNLIRDGLPLLVDADELMHKGAVGDALGYYLDQNGNKIEHKLNGCVMGIELDDLAGIPNVILAAGGLYKVPILRAFLGLKLVNTFVTDQSTARVLLDRKT